MAEALDQWKKGPINPVHEGLTGIIDAYGMGGKGALPNEGVSFDQQGKNALNDDAKTIDPYKELNDSAKAVKRLDSSMNYWLSQGDHRKAQQWAASLIDKSRLDSQKYGQYAVNLLFGVQF